MEEEYLTISEAMPYAKTSESSLRRWVRDVKTQYQIEPSDTNPELAQKTPILRKRNEVQPDGALRVDRNGDPVFEWLLLKTEIDKVFVASDHGQLANNSGDAGQPNDDSSPDSGQPQSAARSGR